MRSIALTARQLLSPETIVRTTPHHKGLANLQQTVNWILLYSFFLFCAYCTVTLKVMQKQHLQQQQQQSNNSISNGFQRVSLFFLFFVLAIKTEQQNHSLSLTHTLTQTYQTQPIFSVALLEIQQKTKTFFQQRYCFRFHRREYSPHTHTRVSKN